MIETRENGVGDDIKNMRMEDILSRVPDSREEMAHRTSLFRAGVVLGR